MLAAGALACCVGCATFGTPQLSEVVDHQLRTVGGVPSNDNDFKFDYFAPWYGALKRAAADGRIAQISDPGVWVLARGIRDGDFSDIDWMQGVFCSNAIFATPRNLPPGGLREQAQALGVVAGAPAMLLMLEPQIAEPVHAPRWQTLIATDHEDLYLQEKDGRLVRFVRIVGLMSADAKRVEQVLAKLDGEDVKQGLDPYQLLPLRLIAEHLERLRAAKGPVAAEQLVARLDLDSVAPVAELLAGWRNDDGRKREGLLAALDQAMTAARDSVTKGSAMERLRAQAAVEAALEAALAAKATLEPERRGKLVSLRGDMATALGRDSAAAAAQGRLATAAALQTVSEWLGRGGAPAALPASRLASQRGRGAETLRKLMALAPALDAEPGSRPADALHAAAVRAGAAGVLGLDLSDRRDTLAAVRAAGGAPLRLVVSPLQGTLEASESAGTRSHTYLKLVERETPEHMKWSREVAPLRSRVEDKRKRLASLEAAPVEHRMEWTSTQRVEEFHRNDKPTPDRYVYEGRKMVDRGAIDRNVEIREERDALGEAERALAEAERREPARTAMMDWPFQVTHPTTVQSWSGEVRREAALEGGLEPVSLAQSASAQGRRFERWSADAATKLTASNTLVTEPQLRAKLTEELDAELVGKLAPKLTEAVRARLEQHVAKAGAKWSEEERALEAALLRQAFVGGEAASPLPLDPRKPLGAVAP